VTSGSGAEPFCELWVDEVDWFLSGDLSLGRVADRKPPKLGRIVRESKTSNKG